LENKPVDFQLLTIRDGRKNKRISFFLFDNSKGQNLQRDKTSSQETEKKKKKRKKKTGIKDLECTPT
jgi:hypothetical protein